MNLKLLNQPLSAVAKTHNKIRELALRAPKPSAAGDPGRGAGAVTERVACTCHDIDIDTFRAVVASGAKTVKTCFKAIGCMPKCNNCIPMVRSVLSDHDGSAQKPAAQPAAIPANASENEDTYEADVQDQDRPYA